MSRPLTISDINLADLSWARAEGTVRNLADRRFDLYGIDWAKRPTKQPDQQGLARAADPAPSRPRRRLNLAGDSTRSRLMPRPIARPGMRLSTWEKRSSKPDRQRRLLERWSWPEQPADDIVLRKLLRSLDHARGPEPPLFDVTQQRVDVLTEGQRRG